MGSIHAELIIPLYTVFPDVKTELLEELQRRTDERVGGENTIGSERMKDTIRTKGNFVDSWKPAM